MRELIDFDNQGLNMHMRGRANFRDVVKYREMLRRRRIFFILDIIAVISFIIGILFYKSGSNISYWAFGITALIILYFIFRKFGRRKNSRRFRQRRHRNRRRNRRR